MSALPFALISLDLDLTFLDSRHRISPRNQAAVRQCRALGARVIITSGRMHCTTLPYWHALELDTPIISYNGAWIRNEGTGEVLLAEHVDEALTAEIVELCDREGLHLNYYLDDKLYVAQENRWSDLYAARTSAKNHPVGNLRVFAGKPSTKLLIVDAPERIAQWYVELNRRYAGRAYITTSNAEYLEIIPPNADKGKALARVAAHFGIPREKVIAFGDARNDIPAIEWAGLGVAVENAVPETRAAAGRVAPHHDEDGVAVVLEELFGLPPGAA